MAYPFASDERREKRGISAWQRAFDWFSEEKRTSFRRPSKIRGGRSLPGLKMEALEPRFLLSADPAPFLVDMAATDGNDLSLRYDALTRSISVYDQQANSLITQKLVSEISYVKVRGTAFDDNLAIDFSDGFVSPVAIEFEGGEGTDSVTIAGAGMSHVNMVVTGTDSGTIVIGDGTDEVAISVSGTDSVNDRAAALQRLYSDATGHGNTLRLSAPDGAASGMGAILSDSMIDYTFVAPDETLTIEGGAGDDTFAVDGVADALVDRVLLSGGAGTDAVVGPPTATLAWNITGADAGDVAGVSFVQVENLQGQADNEDTFVVSEGGSLSGILDGGDGGFDSLVLSGGDYETITYKAFDLHSGTITRDGDVIRYAGLEPITDNMSATDRVFDLTELSDTAELTQDGNGLHLSPKLPVDVPELDQILTFEAVTLTPATVAGLNSLTINLGTSADLPPDLDDPIPFLSRDQLTITGTVDLGGLDLTINGEDHKDVVKIAGDLSVRNLNVNAEIIEVSGSITASGSVTLTSLAEDDGVIVDANSPSFLQGIGLEGFFVAATTATIDISGSITANSGTITMTAEGAVDITTTTGDLAGAGVLDLTGVGVVPDVRVTLAGATLSAQSITGTATADIDIDVADNADGGDTSSTSADAAVSVVVVYGDSGVSVDGSSSITASSGAVTLGAVSEVDVVTKADGSTDAGAKGATLAVSTIGITTALTVDSGATISATGGDVGLTSTLTADVAVDAISTAAGADGAGGGTSSTNQSEQRLADPNDDGATSDQAAAQGGSVSFAGAVVVSDYRPTTSVSIGGDITTDQVLTITAMTTDKVVAKADGTTTGSGATGVGIAVVLGIVDPTVRAIISGGSLTAANGITMSARMDSDDTFSIEAVSGIGDGSKTSIAGSLAIHVVLGSVEARVGGNVDLNSSALTVSALADTRTVTKANPGEDGVTGESMGIGASVALAIIDWQILASVDSNAAITDGAALTMSATHNQDVETTAKSGASGATAVVPVASSSILLSDTATEIGALGAGVSFAGDIGLSATHNAGSLTVAEGAGEGENTAVGISFGLSVDEQTSMVRVLRDLASTGGAVALTANSLIRTRTDAKASAAGAGEDDGSNPDGVNDTNSQQASFADRQTENRTGQPANSRNTTTPDASGSGGGSMSVAAAISLTIQNVETTVTPADGVTISADDLLSLRALSNVDALADADGSAAKGTSGTVGAAASLTYSNVRTTATSGTGTTLVGDGITLEAGVAARDVPLTVSTGETVDTTGDTIFLGDHGLETGDEVVYDNGGGTSITGLTDDDGTTKYYVVKDEGGRVKLATDQNDLENTLVDLQSQGSGDAHTLTKTGEDAITFDPDKDVFALDSTGKATLRTGDAVTYSHEGGDSAIGGLTNGTTYFAIIDADGGLKLAETRDKAFNGDAIELTGTGTGTSHKLTETESRAAADSTSGASGGNLGLAGSLAINVAEVNTYAAHSSGATATLRDGGDGDSDIGALTVKATSDTFAGVDAGAKQEGGGNTGVGFSFGLDITDHSTRAVYETGAILSPGADDITLEATGDYGMRTDVTGGAESTGGTGATPVLGISVALNDTSAIYEAGDALTVSGDVTATATHIAETVTTSKGDAKGANAAAGISFGLTVAEDSVTARLLRGVTSTGGGVTLVAQGAAASRTEAEASAKGAPENNGGDTVNDQTSQQTGAATTQTQQRTSSGATPGSASQGQSQSDASSNGSALTVAAAISLNIADLEVLASVDDGAVIDTTGATEITARGNFDSASKADGSATSIGGGNATNIGAAVALTWGEGDITATVGDADITSGGLTVQALMFDNGGDTTHGFSAEAISGASGGTTGVAGSFALTLPSVTTTATVSDAANVAITGGGNVVVKAEATSSTTTKAGAATEAKKAANSSSGGTGSSGTGSSSSSSGSTLGVGVSIGIAVTDMVTQASLGGASALTGAANLTVEASGTHAMETEVEGGASAAGGTGVTPVIAITVAQNDVSATLPSGDALTISGDLTVRATLDADTSTEAKGSADGTNAAVGAALGLTVSFDSAVATLSRSITAGGAVLVTATTLATSRADARASAKGAASETGNETANGSDVQGQTDSQVGEANSRSGRSASSPNTSTSSGQLTVAAAIGINIAEAEARAVIDGGAGTPITVTGGGAVSVKSSANADANARADGKAASKAADATTIGAAVSVNVAHVDNIALLDNANVTGNGISVQALMATRDRKIEASDLKTVDVDADTIFVGTPEKAFTTGEKVTYSKGTGGTAIDGLSDGEDYYVILADNGRIKLAASLSDAQSGKAVDLKDLGAGDAHELDRTEASATKITFDPDESRFEIALDNPGGLQTGEALVYDTDGTQIGGLTDGETYFAIVDGDGKLKLAADREKALAGEAITLTSTGSGNHRLTEADHATGATSISGAAGGKTGFAGSAALDFAFGTTTATYGETADLTVAGGGDSKVTADTTTISTVRALPNGDATGKTTGVGLSFAFGLTNHDAAATIASGATLSRRNGPGSTPATSSMPRTRRSPLTTCATACGLAVRPATRS